MPSLPTQKPVKVLLTGFGPFRTHLTNASFEIVKRAIAKSGETVEGVSGREVEVVGHREPIRVSYKSVDELLSELYETHPDIDLVIHTGLNATLARSEFLIETIAHRDRYVSPDVDGLVGDDFLSQSKREQWIDNGPLSLSSSVLVAPLIQQVKAQISVPIELKASTDAGRYLCEFIYYDSLLRFHGRDNLNKNPTEVTREAAETDITDHQPGNPLQLPVLFVHVPPSLDLMDLELGGLVLHTIVQEIITLHFSEPLQVIL
ncbi:hypothetical protein Pst134EA_029201 [Puccinia striiformis f. sp. tritici]|uniref:Pyroglutamyl-peptidase I n=2 Tax=Puccinia striiformis TaxID=27350 RepID=A0A0L0UT06_9BASI|nr:hypothetical protein Pst134EA_029201 [Puccinia striiformis f. sp. tritici]KAH9447157.1 hypothetical protein Pst134EA_029201 [Puccinia striiformis f. sp. tritici]KNE90041.1 hypothetical protein PSTG_16517 [Puccinia striiformis f. sp. tritici PST-78]KNE90042.1 hypothetical protein, variant [Puccinia striiformis f. sp. tritici PST-78]POW09545.1 hypothetical protein PSTT_06717 [Puccinia striiformis]